MGRFKIHASKKEAKKAFDLKNRLRWETIDPRDNTPIKNCTKCNTNKESINFAYNYSNLDGLQSWCTPCRQKKNLSDPRKQMVVNARARAVQKKLPFNITHEDFVIPESCPVLNIPIIVGTFQHANSPSLDRITPEKGYAKDNVRVISWRANDVKGNATIDELIKVIEYMKRETTM